MSVFVQAWVYAHSEATGSDRLVLLAIADEADDDGTNAYPSQDRIAHKARLDRRTVQRCIGNLEASGALSVTRPEHRGRGHFNRYTVVMPEVVDNSAEGRHERAASDAERAQKGGHGAARPIDPNTYRQKGVNLTPFPVDNSSRPAGTVLGRGVDAPPLWELDEAGEAVPVRPVTP